MPRNGRELGLGIEPVVQLPTRHSATLHKQRIGAPGDFLVRGPLIKRCQLLRHIEFAAEVLCCSVGRVESPQRAVRPRV